MSYDENDAALDEFYDRISEELYPEHREQAIDEFVSEKMQSFYLNNPYLLTVPQECYNHAVTLIEVSPRSALIMFATSIELFLKSALLKPVLYGMIHNENLAGAIVDATTNQSGFGRYNKLLTSLCYNAANIDLKKVVSSNNKPILGEAEEIQNIRNRVIHQGYIATTKEAESARLLGFEIIHKVVLPVLASLNLKIKNGENGIKVEKA